MDRKKLLSVIFLLVISLMFTFTGCYGTYVDSEQNEDQDVIIMDNTHEESGESNQTDNDSNVDEYDEYDEETNDSYVQVVEAGDYSVFENALFIGDSRTEGLQLYSGIKGADFFCAKGLSMYEIVNGETVNMPGGISVSIRELLEQNDYSRVYIGLGMNDLGMKYIEEFIEQYELLIAMVQELQPESEIYVQALIPVTQEKSDNHEYVNNGQIFWYNSHIYEMTENLDVTYVNPDNGLVGSDGALIPDGSFDGVHFSKEYCIIWANNLAEMTE